ncbi:double C2-like domain-containing protein (DOC2) [Plasmodium ovale wallikeri]|uniref:Double C2-like domain-containing protein (DOC2) n=1 Tax=Plasmodium ovale wallikeri TaxID=864142 RepID=A0A1A9A2T8_PLAOA|nr:double C2-like domain-containing protein (DOC2) [Plasmodium ovale wallikeri]SBT50484.1 double C2-like domain-containing protein (DOC2) [Plasmodium ovale wallikeri]
MLDKFKNIVNLNNSGAQKGEGKNGEANENQDPNLQIPGELTLGETEEKTFFDEMLGAPQYTYDEFLQVLKTPQEERGDTEDLKKHWGYPRRWKVVLWDLQIQNYMNNDFNAFVDFDFGGNREECRIQYRVVATQCGTTTPSLFFLPATGQTASPAEIISSPSQRGSTMKIYAKGKAKNCLRTNVVSNVVAEQKKEINFTNVFEYRGSYLDLENEKLRIKVWEYKQFTLNKLEGIYEEPLLSFAVGQIHNETILYKFIKDARVKRCRLFFQLYFQEMYDFELSFLNWSFSDLLSYSYIQAKSLHYFENTGKGIKRYIEGSQCSLFPKGCINIKNLRKKKKKINNRRKDIGYDTDKKLSFNTAMSEDSGDNNDRCKNKNEKIAKNLEKLFFRNLSLMQNIEENEDDSYRNLEDVKFPNPRVTITLTHTPKGHEGLSLVSIEQKNVNFPVWENLGELYFRGTLRDLDVTYLHVNAFSPVAGGGIHPPLLRFSRFARDPLRVHSGVKLGMKSSM